jgi:hypothetical protein
MNTLRNAAISLALAAAAATAHAGVKASAVTTYNALRTSTPDEVFVPLNNAGATTISFNLSSAGKKVLTYSAECAAFAPLGYGGWLDIDIYVNGVIVAPTANNEDAFCTAHGAEDDDPRYVRASITVAIQGILGNNTIRIKARGSGGATGLWLGDSALVVYD